jgi:hypothetical protein
MDYILKLWSWTAVVTVTRYEPDGLGIESRWGRDFRHQCQSRETGCGGQGPKVEASSPCSFRLAQAVFKRNLFPYKYPNNLIPVILPTYAAYEDGTDRQTECSEMPTHKIHRPGNHPKERIRHSEHGKILKSRNIQTFVLFIFWGHFKFLLLIFHKFLEPNRSSALQIQCVCDGTVSPSSSPTSRLYWYSVIC